MVILCLYVCGHIILELELDFCSDDCFDVWDDFYMLYIFSVYVTSFIVWYCLVNSLWSLRLYVCGHIILELVLSVVISYWSLCWISAVTTVFYVWVDLLYVIYIFCYVLSFIVWYCLIKILFCVCLFAC